MDISFAKEIQIFKKGTDERIFSLEEAAFRIAT